MVRHEQPIQILIDTFQYRGRPWPHRSIRLILALSEIPWIFVLAMQAIEILRRQTSGGAIFSVLPGIGGHRTVRNRDAAGSADASCETELTNRRRDSWLALE
ncbi:hypothetical protein PY365_03625 [Roseiarcaceae bacterium H3SJ34-1]|uniref:hypothetical protein n=1 Tax=Terripilifer ovatus TaxID=3032367 RepID=UPI003AB95718|nr:hypothetical protein [Roseiarcaceae bacterium H3SJ34-1]